MSSPDTGADRVGSRRGLPRLADVGLASLGGVLCAPVLAVFALAVLLTSRGPVLFRQRRVGLGGAEFALLKLRTMRVNDDPPGATASGDPRITQLGRWLRPLKLDHLPEIWNVIRGDMSLVGPRPELPCYVDLTDPVWGAVLSDRPGITDPVTLRLLNEESLIGNAPGDSEEFYRQVLQPYKLAGYLEYQRRRSVAADIGVIVRTLGALLVPSATATAPIDIVAAATTTSPLVTARPRSDA